MKVTTELNIKDRMRASDLVGFKELKQLLKDDEYTAKRYFRQAMEHRLGIYLPEHDILECEAMIIYTEFGEGRVQYGEKAKNFSVRISGTARTTGYPHDTFYTANFELADIWEITYGEKQEGIFRSTVVKYSGEEID